MRPYYTDLYVLFRHKPRAEAYFEGLPAQVRDKISAQYRLVDSMDRLRAFAARYQGGGGQP